MRRLLRRDCIRLALGASIALDLRPCTSERVPMDAKRIALFRQLQQEALSSGLSDVVRQSYVENFVSSVQPSVLANEIGVPNAPAHFSVSRPGELTRVLSLSLPIPMPVALVLNGWSVLKDRFRQAARLPAERTKSAGIVDVVETGRFIVEWGSGAAKNYLFTDFAPGSIQIPVTTSLNVYVHSRRDGAADGAIINFAQAQAYPGATHPRPHAVYTAQAVQMGGDPDLATPTTALPPYVRSVDASVFTGESPASARANFELVGSLGIAAIWVLNAPNRAAGAFVPTPFVVPHEVIGALVPSSAFAWRIQMRGLGAAPAIATASFTFGVEV